MPTRTAADRARGERPIQSRIAKHKIIAHIAAARAELEKTIEDLEALTAVDPASVSFAAHAMSSFVAVCTGCVSLLRDRLADYPDQDVQQWLKGIQHAAGLINQTANGLANRSLSAGLELHRENIDLARLVKKSCLFYDRIAADKKIRIAFSTDVKNAEVFADRVAVAAVLDNLLSNAIKYSPECGKIKVSVREKLRQIICSVADEGPGITAKEQEMLFSRGLKFGATPTGGEPKHGFGLAVAKELVGNLGGSIWCESESGKGARFCFRLPLVTE